MLVETLTAKQPDSALGLARLEEQTQAVIDRIRSRTRLHKPLKSLHPADSELFAFVMEWQTARVTGAKDLVSADPYYETSFPLVASGCGYPQVSANDKLIRPFFDMARYLVWVYGNGKNPDEIDDMTTANMLYENIAKIRENRMSYEQQNRFRNSLTSNIL